MAKACRLLLVYFFVFYNGKKSPYWYLSNIPALITTSEVMDLISHAVVTLAGHYMPDWCCCPLLNALSEMDFCSSTKRQYLLNFPKILMVGNW